MSTVKYQRDKPVVLTAQRDAELKALARQTDDAIDYSDIPASGDEQWPEAVLPTAKNTGVRAH